MRVHIATNALDRGSTSRTLEAWTRLLPSFGVRPSVTVGGKGPLLDALRARSVATAVRPLSLVPRRVWPFPFVAAVARLAATLRWRRARLVHVNEHDSHFLAACAGRLAGIPIVTHLRFRPEPDYCRWLFRPALAPARLFFTSETQMRDSAAAIEPHVSRDRWRLLPNGLDVASYGRDPGVRARIRSGWKLDDGTVALGTACAIAPHKRVDHFVRLVARLHAAGIPVRGFVAGKAHFPKYEPLVQELRALAVDLGVGDRVDFLGYVEPLEPVYHAWDLCVSTSEYETFGMTVLEAMACETACIAYPGGAVAEVAGGAAAIVPDRDEDALFRTCRDACLQAGRRRELAAAGRRRVVERYDIVRAVERLSEEYRAVDAERTVHDPGRGARAAAPCA